MSIVNSVQDVARINAKKTAFTFLVDGELLRTSVTYLELNRCAEAYAAFFRSRGLIGERCVIALPSSPEFIFAFLGCLYAGVTAVPSPPLRARDKRSWERIDAVAMDCGAAAIVATRAMVIAASEQSQKRLQLQWLAPDDVDLSITHCAAAATRSPAFLQYTSGSTASPRGVVVSHENLAANIQAIGSKLDVRPDSVAVSWLPLHHDMGLIGVVLSGLSLGIELALMSPTHFIQKPLRWLRMITEFGGTHSGGPDFAYALCSKRITSADLSDIDLSSWRLAFAGAETVRMETLEAFAANFAKAQFDRRSFYPCYGLAEATLLVSGRGRRPAVTRRIDRACLASDRAVAVSKEQPGVDVVSCGTVIDGHHLSIVAPTTGKVLLEDEIGEVWLSGPCVCAGYWTLQAQQEACFGLTINGRGGYLRTGDLGFLHAGELFLTGRLKDVIVLYGRKIYPQDVERALENISTIARLGSATAFGNRDADEDVLVVVQEVLSLHGERPEDLARKLATAVAMAVDVRPKHVILVPLGSIPKTTSGKLRRLEARAIYMRNDFRTILEPQEASTRLDDVVQDASVGPVTPHSG